MYLVKIKGKTVDLDMPITHKECDIAYEQAVRSSEKLIIDVKNKDTNER